jgi:uncharacterized protein (DUF885 family)
MGKRSRNGCSVTFSCIAIAAGVGLAVRLASGQEQRPTPPEAATSNATSGRSPALLAILDEHVEFLKRDDPLEASRRGDSRFNTRLPDSSPETIAARRTEMAARLARAKALDRRRFTEEDHTDADLLIYDLSLGLAEAEFYPEQIPISTMGGPQIGLPQMADRLRIVGEQDRADYAARLKQVPRVIENAITQMRAGLAAGRVPPRITMHAAASQASAQASADIRQDPTRSPFYKPFLGSPEEDPLAAAARRTIADEIAPAYEGLAEFLAGEYIPRCRESVGASEGVDGIRAYDLAVRSHTTLDLSSDEIHRIGLDEVARIRGEMDEVIARSDFPGAKEAPSEQRFAAFVEFLRTSPRFYYTNEDDLLDGYRVICKRIDPELSALFRRLPQNPYGVRALPAFSAPSSPTAYYYPGSIAGGVPGYFMANTYRLDQRPKYSMIALTLHEAVPGHHLQITLSQELEGQHEFRTWVGFTAFVEGWALYAERLGLEMTGNPRGLFADPYDDFGRLNFEMWRACRLVVDTGIHANGWTRQQGIDFIMRNSALALYDVEREVDRYIGWPGQATGYKIGELKIRELRAGAEKALGPSFDIREFHDVILGAGTLPLPVLESRVTRYIKSTASR